MNTKKIAIIIAAAVSACAPTTPATEPTALDLAGSEWAVESGTEAQFIQFTVDRTILGNLGCNRFNGKFNQDGQALSFGPIMSTKMACLDMDKEVAFSAALGNTRSFDGDHLKIVLKSETGEALVTLLRRDWD